MGGGQSKEEQLYQAVQNANHTAVKSLRRDGTSLEWVDKEGRTPLVLACTKSELFDMVITLLNLGASIKAYRPGHHGGYPLHHAAKRGLDKTVILLLSRGADPMALNDDGQSALDMARHRGHVSVVRILEDRVCLFSGVMREISGPGFLEALAPQWVTRKIWAVVLPSSSPTRRMARNELVVYQSPKVSLPRTVIPLNKVQIEEPNFSTADPVMVLTDKSSKTRFKFLSEFEGRKHQIEKFYRACKGLGQSPSPQESVSPGRPNRPTRANSDPPITIVTPKFPPPPPASQQPQPLEASCRSKDNIIPEDVALAMAINASLQSANAEGLTVQGEWGTFNSSPTKPSSRRRASADVRRSNSDTENKNLWGSLEAGPSRVYPQPPPPFVTAGPPSSSRLSSRDKVENIWETSRLVKHTPPVRNVPVRDPSAPPSGPPLVVQVSQEPASRKIPTTSTSIPVAVPVAKNPAAAAATSAASAAADAAPASAQAPASAAATAQAPAAAHEGTTTTTSSSKFSLFGIKKKAVASNEENSKTEKMMSGQCVVCWDAPARGVCIPCGHLAGCMTCLMEIKEKTWGCPVCRTSIQQVIKVYAV